MPKTISRDFPISELTLRRYEKPSSNNKRENVRKFCLSLGLLQPGDSRDVVVDIFQVLLDAKDKKMMMNSEDIKKSTVEYRKKAKLPLKGIASSNVRRQLKRLRDIHMAEKVKNDYRITEFEDISILVDEKIEKFLLQNILKRVKEYSKLL
ncbi:MAG: hypothetical protein Q8L34_00440 [Candidatus Woesearchaeota archaeon]|nr:hypothetical protein [Candidatus Woesearchaeota archaeon]